MIHGLRAPLLLPALALWALGCGGAAHEATLRQLAELRSEVMKLRSDQAAFTERLESLELGRGLAPRPTGAPRPEVPVAADPDRPALEVVRLAPSTDPDDPASDAPRPVVRVNGGAAPPKKKDRVERPSPPRSQP